MLNIEGNIFWICHAALDSASHSEFHDATLSQAQGDAGLLLF